MVTVAGDAGRSSPTQGLAMGTAQVVFHHTHVAAATEGRNVLLFRHTQEAARRAHGIGGVLGIASVAGIAGNAVLGVDAAPPELDRLAVFLRQGAVAFKADD